MLNAEHAESTATRNLIVRKAVLAPALVYFIPAGLGAPARATIFSVVYAISLMGRPIDSMIFGHFGDRLGRRVTMIFGFAIATIRA